MDARILAVLDGSEKGKRAREVTRKLIEDGFRQTALVSADTPVKNLISLLHQDSVFGGAELRIVDANLVMLGLRNTKPTLCGISTLKIINNNSKVNQKCQN